MMVLRVVGRWLVVIACLGGLLWSVRADAQELAPRSFRVEVSGSGPAMILIPGLASSGDTWRSTVDHYRGRFECHVLTLAGFAGVPPIDLPLLATFREELAAYIKKLRTPVIVGHSLGGTMALAIAADHPDLVGPLVIVDSLPFLGGVVFNVNSAADAAPQIAMMRAGMENLTRAQFDMAVQSGMVTRGMTTGDANDALVRQWTIQSDVRTVAHAMADVYGLDLRADIARITSPTLVLGTWIGVREQLQAAGITLTRDTALQNFNAQFASLKGARIVLSDTSRHFVMLDEPQWLTGEMDRFLGK